MIALVTGANRGIGLEVVRQLAALGHTVLLTARDKAKGLAAQATLSHRERIHAHQLDVTDSQSVAKVREYVLTEFGRLDILINNAGINYDTWHHVLDADLENVHETLETNLFGAWAITQAFVPSMQQQGYGRIVNVSSGAGAIQGMGGGTPGYSISKAALNVLTIKTAAQLRGNAVLVNAVCPGWVRTDMGGAGASRSVSKGAETIIWAATLDKRGPSGKFFRDKKEIPF